MHKKNSFLRFFFRFLEKKCILPLELCGIPGCLITIAIAKLPFSGTAGEIMDKDIKKLGTINFVGFLYA